MPIPPIISAVRNLFTKPLNCLAGLSINDAVYLSGALVNPALATLMTDLLNAVKNEAIAQGKL